MSCTDLPGVHPARNIQGSADTYELENRAIDPDGTLRAALRDVAPWTGRVVVDLGCGAGFHLPMFAAEAAHVVGVEPHGRSRALAVRRVGDLCLENVSVMTGSAEHILLPDASVDVVHSMFAYFFGPGSEPGVTEVARVLEPGGTHVIVDNAPTGTFASWLRRSSYVADSWRPEDIAAFWASQGYDAAYVESAWRFRSRADLEAVVAMEFEPPRLLWRLGSPGLVP